MVAHHYDLQFLRETETEGRFESSRAVWKFKKFILFFKKQGVGVSDFLFPENHS